MGISCLAADGFGKTTLSGGRVLVCGLGTDFAEGSEAAGVDPRIVIGDAGTTAELRLPWVARVGDGLSRQGGAT